MLDQSKCYHSIRYEYRGEDGTRCAICDIKSLEGEVNQLRSYIGELEDEAEQRRADNRRLSTENERLRAALAVFADPLAWDPDFRFVNRKILGYPFTFARDVLNGMPVEAAAAGAS